jgi:3-phenylpropionate/trans-cinnamate dioxygenase ferredoxin reductase subunit
MSVLHVKYLLVGGGVASSAAAAAIRELDAEGDLLLVGQEINRPYRRPPLAREFLRGQMAREELFVQPAGWFVQHGISLRTGRRASRLDTSRNCVTLDSGEEISFDRLLIATGGTPAPLIAAGAQLPNLFYLRTLEDADRLQHAIDKARREGRSHDRGRGKAVVIGAGPLGLEIAGSLAQCGLRVDIALARDYPYDQFVGEATGRCLLRLLEKHGIVAHPRGNVLRLEGDGRVQRAVLADGATVDCDFAVAAVGLHVTKDLLRGTPIVAEKAILVNERCQSSVPNIYAAGDCAAVLDPLFGKHRMMHHWETAALTGRLAGTNMAGGEARFDAVTHFRGRVLQLDIDIWGEPRRVDSRIIRGTISGESPRFVEIGIAPDGRIAQVVAIGGAEDPQTLAELVRRRLAVAADRERLMDPAVPLQEIISR